MVSVFVIVLLDALCLCVPAPAATLRTFLRDNETFSAYLTDQLSVPVPVLQSLLEARVKPGLVSVAPSTFQNFLRDCLQP